MSAVMQDSIRNGGRLDEVDLGIIDFLRQRRSGCAASDLLAGLAAKGHKISQPTLSRRLARLQAERHVIAHKAGRSTFYERDPYHDWFSVPPSRRKKVPYNFGCLEGYEPSETRWLTQAETDRLMEAGGGRKLDATTYSRAIAQKLLVDLSYASSALEGNTYSYIDTQVLIEFGQAAQGKAAEETQMILNHKEAIVYLIDNIAEIEISPRQLKTLHALLSRGLLEPAAVGSIRQVPVDIGASAYVPMSIPQKLEEELAKIASRAAAIDHPFEQSLFLLAFVSYLQAFKDVNKRTARLACNIPLLRNGLAPLSFIEVDKARYVEGLLAFYELNRIDMLKEAYIDGYVASAARYDAYAGRDRTAIELELSRRADIYACVRAFVEKAVSDGHRGDPVAFANDFFRNDPDGVRPKLAERVAEIVAALHDGNHIAYGISKDLFDKYAKVLNVRTGA